MKGTVTIEVSDNGANQITLEPAYKTTAYAVKTRHGGVIVAFWNKSDAEVYANKCTDGLVCPLTIYKGEIK